MLIKVKIKSEIDSTSRMYSKLTWELVQASFVIQEQLQLYFAMCL